MFTPEKGFQELQAYAAAQEVLLDPLIEHAGVIGASLGNSECRDSVVYEPAPIYAAVGQAGKILRRNPQAALANKPLQIPPDDLQPQDVALRTLVTLVNGSLDRMARNVPSHRLASCRQIPATHACSEAETFFASVIWQMANPTSVLSEDEQMEPFGYQIITDDYGQALGIRKGVSWPTLLTLEEIAINGVPYPPGSIMRADMPYERYARARLYRPMRDFEEQERIDFHDIARLGFMRLSAFVLAGEQRQTVFAEAMHVPESSVQLYSLRPEIEEIVATWPLERIKAQAADTVQRLGAPVGV
jgi:hypothetical protein